MKKETLQLIFFSALSFAFVMLVFYIDSVFNSNLAV
jgi:hypothetical protein